MLHFTSKCGYTPWVFMLMTGCLLLCVLRPTQAALKSFDDDHNGALDEPEFERFAKSLMSTGRTQPQLGSNRIYMSSVPATG
jgi:hypothetical protein